MKRFLVSSLAVIAVTGGMLAIDSAAALADVKIYTAGSCRVPIIANVSVSSFGVVLNNSLTLPVSIVCPIVRDHPSLKPTSVAVSVVDNSSLLIGAGAITCRLVASNRFGTQNSLGGLVSTVGTNSAGTILNLSIPAVLFVDGSYSVGCAIPRRGVGDPSSSVATIKVTEAIASP